MISKTFFPAVHLTRNNHEALLLFILDYLRDSIEAMSHVTVISDSDSLRFEFAKAKYMCDAFSMQN